MKSASSRHKTMEQHANAAMLRDPDVLWDCARELYFTRMGGGTIANETAWNALPDAEREAFAFEAIALQREHSKTLAHLPAPAFLPREENGPLLSG